MKSSFRAVPQRQEICDLLERAYLGVAEIAPAGRGRAVIHVNFERSILEDIRGRCQEIGLDFDRILQESIQQITWQYQAELDQRKD